MNNKIKILLQEIASTLIIVGACIAITIPIQNHYIKNRCNEMIERYEQEHKQELEDAKRTYVIEFQHRLVAEEQTRKAIENNERENAYER